MSAIYFATNRNPVEQDGTIVDFGINFSQAGLHDLRFGVAEMVSVSVFPEEGSSPASIEVFARVKAKMAEQARDTLVLIHGYATSFRQAIEGAHKTKEAYKSANLNVILFSWPSDGAHAPHDYGNDRHDAQASGLAFARGILKLAEFLEAGKPCGRRIHLLAHSMGNFVLRHALQALIAQAPGDRLPLLFTNIFNMAADEDADAFDKPEKYARLPELAKAVNVYINAHDHALQGSTLTKGNPDRLGNTGPATPQNLPAKVTVVDVTKTDRLFLDLVGHGYYDENPTVIRDVLQVLAGAEAEDIPTRIYVPAKNRYRIG
jgi:esterase/lipase superfamily enzyme